MATAVPIPEHLKPEHRRRKPPSEFWEELTFVPKEEELFDPSIGPAGRRTPATVSGGIARMIRKNIFDPFYKGGLVTGRAKRGQPPTPLELLEVSALGALPRVSGGLGSGPGIAKPFRSRLLESLKKGKIGKRDLGKAPKAQSLVSAIKRGGFHPDELKYSGIMGELGKMGGEQRVLMHDVVAQAAENLPIPIKKTVLSEERAAIARKISDAVSSMHTRRLAQAGRMRKAIQNVTELGKMTPEQIDMFTADPKRYNAYVKLLQDVADERLKSAEILHHASIQRDPTYMSQPQYTQYATPGGTKHKETLYHWKPAKPASRMTYDDIQAANANRLSNNLSASNLGELLYTYHTRDPEYRRVGLRIGEVLTNPRRFSVEDSGLTVRGETELVRVINESNISQSDKNDLLIHIGNYLEELPDDVKMDYTPRGFESQHYQTGGYQRNLLAHTLTDTRKVGGKQVTHLSEMQSDWLQKLATGEAVPDAPFREHWHKVLGRDLVAQAVEEGSEGITWSTSELLVDRYSPTYQKFYEDLYDKKIPGFFKKEYGVKPVKARAEVAPKGRTTVDQLRYEGIRPDEWIVEGFDMTDDPYSGYVSIIPEPSIVEWMDAQGLPQDIMRQWLNMGEASFTSERNALAFQRFLDAWYKEQHPFEGSLWYIPITDKMKQIVREGQFQAATPKRKEEAVA